MFTISFIIVFLCVFYFTSTSNTRDCAPVYTHFPVSFPCAVPSQDWPGRCDFICSGIRVAASSSHLSSSVFIQSHLLPTCLLTFPSTPRHLLSPGWLYLFPYHLLSSLISWRCLRFSPCVFTCFSSLSFLRFFFLFTGASSCILVYLFYRCHPLSSLAVSLSI